MNKLLLAVLAVFLLVPPAYAQLAGTDTKPGDACTAGEEGYVRRNASTDRDASEITLMCDGSHWQSATGGGLAALQGQDDTGPCTVAKDGLIRYRSSGNPKWEYCDGGTTSWLPFKLPQCQDNDAGECTLPLSRSSADGDLVAASIRCGLNVLGVTGTYDCTTDPAAFSFTDLTGQNLTTQVSSNTLTPAGYTDPRPVSVTGQGSPQVSINGGPWVTSGWILPGYTLQARLTSAAAYDTPYAATVSVGGISDSWSVRTKVQDTTPDAFNFVDQTNVQLSTLTTSANITPTGYDGPVTVSVSGQGSPQVSINGGSWGSGGPINPGETLAVRLTSSAAYLTTLTASVTVGGTSDSWTVQSRPDVTVINISSNVANVNLFTLAGSPATAGSYEFVIAAGANVYATSTAAAALSTGVFPAGSTVKIINNGSIVGMGGGGGNAHSVGGSGGPAISMGFDATIDNSAGAIYGGGGGGGGSRTGITWGGGGGGGGQSYQASSGGSGAAAMNPSYSGQPGGSGTFSGAGVGGNAGAAGTGKGGNGGAWGSAGAAGNPNTAGGSIGPGGGGAAGKAVNINGKTITWLGGNDGTHVKGAVN